MILEIVLATVPAVIAAPYLVPRIKQAFMFDEDHYNPFASKPKVKATVQVVDAAIDTLIAEQDAFWTKYEAALFAAVPSAWWLDPTRWGDLPAKAATEDYPIPRVYGRTPIGSVLPYDPKMYFRSVMRDAESRPAPRCRHCKGNNVIIKACNYETDWGEHTALCKDCGCYWEIVPHGKKDWRMKKRTVAEIRTDLIEPQVTEERIYQDKAFMNPPAMPGDRLTADDVYPRLPCGCVHSTPIEHVRGPDYRYSVCKSCFSWWEPPSNSNDGRELAQGESAHSSNIPIPGIDGRDAYRYGGVKRPRSTTK